jgi:hypothetical protein
MGAPLTLRITGVCCLAAAVPFAVQFYRQQINGTDESPFGLGIDSGSRHACGLGVTKNPGSLAPSATGYRLLPDDCQSAI